MNDPNAHLLLLKKELRARLRARLREIPAARRERDSALARALLAGREEWRRARAILFYAAQPEELDLGPLLEQALAEGRMAALPRFLPETGAYAVCQIENFSRDCAPGKFGIREPAARCPVIALNRLDLALVPGVGFDADGRRLGRGRGHYDRLLAQVAGTKCGVAFDEQMAPEIPVAPHDVILNRIVTPTRWLEVPGQRPILP
jgi:5-formyltetrahydrofolate cyclo-ligase